MASKENILLFREKNIQDNALHCSFDKAHMTKPFAIYMFLNKLHFLCNYWNYKCYFCMSFYFIISVLLSLHLYLLYYNNHVLFTSLTSLWCESFNEIEIMLFKSFLLRSFYILQQIAQMSYRL